MSRSQSHAAQLQVSLPSPVASHFADSLYFQSFAAAPGPGPQHRHEQVEVRTSTVNICPSILQQLKHKTVAQAAEHKHTDGPTNTTREVSAPHEALFRRTIWLVCTCLSIRSLFRTISRRSCSSSFSFSSSNNLMLSASCASAYTPSEIVNSKSKS